MLGHDDEGVEEEAVERACAVEFGEEEVPRTGFGKERRPLVAREGDEAGAVGGFVALESLPVWDGRGSRGRGRTRGSTTLDVFVEWRRRGGRRESITLAVLV